MKKTIMKAIDFELTKAKHKHPDFPKDCRHQLAVLSEEAGEVAQAVNNYCEDTEADQFAQRDHIFEELCQTAAVCVRMIESMMEEGKFLRRES